MKTILLACCLLLLLPTALHAQGATPVGTANGRVQLLLLDASRQPVGGAMATFVSEAQAPLASCTTDRTGRCTLRVDNAPADASGFIRGAIVVQDRGRKPLIWPGGEIEVELVLDETGQLDIPHDLYPTRVPKATELVGGTPSSVPAAEEPTATVAATSAVPTPTPPVTSPPATASATAIPPAGPSPSVTLSAPLEVSLRTAINQQRAVLLLGSAVLLLVALYLWLGRRNRNQEDSS